MQSGLSPHHQFTAVKLSDLLDLKKRLDFSSTDGV